MTRWSWFPKTPVGFARHDRHDVGRAGGRGGRFGRARPVVAGNNRIIRGRGCGKRGKKRAERAESGRRSIRWGPFPFEDSAGKNVTNPPLVRALGEGNDGNGR